MNYYSIDEKNSIYSNIDALPLSDLERSRAHVALAKADALVGTFFALFELLNRRQGGRVYASEPEASKVGKVRVANGRV